MNCVKCPILEECEARKYTTHTEYNNVASIPIKITPNNPDDCSILKLIRESK